MSCPSADRALVLPAGAARRNPVRALLAHPAWSYAAFLMVAFNLRPAITSIAPFIEPIRTDLGLSSLGISALTTAPVLCLGLFAPTAPLLARRFGTEPVLIASLLGIVLGVIIRSFGVVPLFAGTLVIGASMSLLGVLSPALAKRDFPHRVGTMMGLYSMLVSLGAAMSTATAVPLQRAFHGSWEMALMSWAVPALAGAALFLPHLFRTERRERAPARHAHGVFRHALAWQVTGFFSLISALAYAIFNWGPTMLQARGFDAATSGLIMSMSYLTQMITGLAMPIWAARSRDQRWLVALVVVLTTAGLVGFVFAPPVTLPGFAVALGLGQGGAFGLALALIVLRSGDPDVAAELSSLTQTVGYVACGLLGPFAVGMLHGWSGSWPVVAGYYLILGAGSLLLGLGAGRAQVIAPRAPKRAALQEAAAGP